MLQEPDKLVTHIKKSEKKLFFIFFYTVIGPIWSASAFHFSECY